jgi:hypothetical protein
MILNDLCETRCLIYYIAWYWSAQRLEWFPSSGYSFGTDSGDHDRIIEYYKASQAPAWDLVAFDFATLLTQFGFLLHPGRLAVFVCSSVPS